ncbi:MAG: ATP-binding protein, partial [Candidatus Omnitrophota bacterium]
LLKDEYGSNVAILASGEDITDKREAEQGLKLFRNMIDSSNDAIYVIDPVTSNILDVNNTACNILGYKTEQLLSKKIIGIDALIDTDEKWAKHVKDVREKRSVIFESRHRRSDDSEFPVEISVKYYKYEKDFMLAIVRDITERKKSQERINDLAKFPEENPNPIIRINNEGRPLYMNQPVKEMLRKLQLPVEGIFQVLPKNILQIIKDSLKDNHIRMDLEAEIEGKIFLYTVVPISNEKYVNLYAVDITRRRESEQKVHEAIAVKSDFISMVSHELRTPLTAIKESIAIVRDEIVGKVGKDQKEYLDMAKQNVDRLARLINDVLDFQKLEVGKTQISLMSININNLIKDVRDTLHTMAKAKKLRFLLKLDNQVVDIKADRDRIIQVITNLTSNAIGFTEKGSVQIETIKEAENIHIMIKDTGVGIMQKDLPRLFSKFEQLTYKSYRKTGGTGLGLAISKEIVTAHEGKIWAESEFNKGTTFHILLPIK